MINLKTQRAKQEWARHADRIMQSVERPVSRMLSAEFNRVASAGAAFNKAQHRSAVQRIVQHDCETTGILFADLYFKTKKTAGLQLEVKLDTEAEAKKRILKRARARAQQIADDIAATTKIKIRRAITVGLANNKTPREIAKDILLRVGGAVGQRRAMTIARTETHGAAQGALLDSAMEDSEALGTKEWISTNDDRTRPDHVEVNGQQVHINEKFKVGGESLAFPGDPSGSPENIINCRCQIIFGG